jgi:prepilin-type N-terminal cleavage/methylation domain-containing protein
VKHSNTSSRGFTIVELLIVIVVIGVLAALVLNSFAGVQAKARDVERDTDVKAVATQLEALYNQAGAGSYPPTYATNTTVSGATGANLQYDADVSGSSGALKGIDLGSLRAPGKTTNSYFFTNAATTGNPTATAGATTSQTNAGIDGYLYQPLTAGNAVCTAEGACTHFNIYYQREGAVGTLVTKASLNK